MHEPHDRLLNAVREGHVDAASAALQEGASVDARDGRGHTALMLACARYDGAMVRCLLAAGASPNRRTTHDEETVLHQLARQPTPEGLTMLKVILAESPRVDRIDRYGWTPLMVAAQMGAVDHVSALLAAGADTAVQEPDGRTASTLAKDAGHLDVLGLL